MADIDDDDGPALPVGQPNYMTLASFNTLQAEALALIDVERPEFTRLVNWAASNGDRSENADYHYGKKRLREIDRRIGYIQRRLKLAMVVNPAEQTQRDRVFFGATVTYVLPDGTDKTIEIVGIDEADVSQGKISFIAPVARAMLGKYVGDEAILHLPEGKIIIEVDAISYPSAT